MINFNKKIIVVAGPTASGKSSIAIQLAKDINGYIINADSKQIYKGLIIGTAQPTDTQGIEHYLYGHVDPSEKYNLYRYQNDVQKILNQKKDSNQTPILVGGTGLYIDSIIFNYDLDENLSSERREELEKLSLEDLKLLAKDWIDDMNESDRENPIRLIRSIEREGISFKKGNPLNHTYFVVDPGVDIVEKNIKTRVEQMLNEGLIEENKRLRKVKIEGNSPVSRIIGYQEFNGYFEKEKTLEDVKKDIITHTIQYSKRQRTWFRRNKEAVWIKNYNDLESNLLINS